MRSKSINAVLLLFSLFAFTKAYAYEEANKNRVHFQPEGCEFSVDFPDRPTLKDESGDNFTRHIAKLDAGNTYLQAACTVFSAEQPLEIPDDETLSLWGWAYASRNNIRLPEIEVKETLIGKLVIIKGSALKDNWAHIFKVHSHLGKTSKITLTASASSEHYPTPELTSFLESIQRPQNK